MRTSISDASRHASLFDDEAGGSPTTAEDVASAIATACTLSSSVGTNEEATAGVGDGDCRMEDVEKKMVSISGRANEGSATALCCSCNFSNNSEATAAAASTSSSSSRSCRCANVAVVFASRWSSSREISTARHGGGNDIF